MNNIIEVKNLDFVYPDGTRALKDINLIVPSGQSIGIIGPNGAGKSTFLLHLSGILQGKTGQIVIDGVNIDSKNLKTIRQKIGFVFQNPDDQLFMPTVAEDIAFGPLNLSISKGEIPELVKKALASVKLNGFEGRSSHHLSAGEKKRVALAAVLVMNPKILIFDEPSANLDPRTRRDFIKLIKNITATKIIASHDLAMIEEITDQTIIIYQGKKAAEGLTKTIINDHSLLESFGF